MRHLSEIYRIIDHGGTPGPGIGPALVLAVVTMVGVGAIIAVLA